MDVVQLREGCARGVRTMQRGLSPVAGRAQQGEIGGAGGGGRAAAAAGSAKAHRRGAHRREGRRRAEGEREDDGGELGHGAVGWVWASER